MSLTSSCLIANLQIGLAAGAPKAIIAAGAAVRNHFYVNTLTWKDNGDRLLPYRNFTAFMGGHLALKKAFTQLATIGVDAPEKFYVRLDLDLAPGEDHIETRHEFDAALVAQLQARMERAAIKRLARARGDLLARLLGPLTHFATTMVGDKAFRDATVNNLMDARTLVSRLNFVDDQNIEDMVYRCGFLPSAVELRKNAVSRAKAAETAKQILLEIEETRA